MWHRYFEELVNSPERMNLIMASAYPATFFWTSGETVAVKDDQAVRSRKMLRPICACHNALISAIIGEIHICPVFKFRRSVPSVERCSERMPPIDRFGS